MKAFKRLAVSGLALAMSLGLLAACTPAGTTAGTTTGATTGTTTGTVEPSESTTSETPTESESEAPTESESEMPSESESEQPSESEEPTESESEPSESVGEPVTGEGEFWKDLDNYDGGGAKLVYHTIGGIPEDLQKVQDAINEYTSEVLNSTIELTFHGWNDYSDNLNNIINTGEAWDLAFGASISGYHKFAQDGIFADVKPLLAHAPELEDLTPVLKQMKDDAPDKYPMYLDKNGINSLTFDYEGYGGGAAVKFGTEEVINMYEDEALKQRFWTLREWYEAGYINPDANTSEEIPKGANPISSAQGFEGADSIWTANFGSEVISNPRLGPMYTTGSIQGSFITISEGSDNQEQAIKFLERLNLDRKLRNLYAYGIEGEHYNFHEGDDSVIERTQDGQDKYNVPAYSQGQFMSMFSVFPNPADMWIKVAKQNEAAEASKLLGFVPNTEAVRNEIAALDAAVKKYANALNTGSQDADQLLQQLVDEQKTIGIDRVIEEFQKQVDDFLAQKG